MRKFYSILRCFVFIAFSLNGVKADLLLNKENIQTIKDLSEKENFEEEDVYKCFSLFGFDDGKLHFPETAKEIKQILERGKTDALGYEILANLQKILAKFLVYDIQYLSIHPVDIDFAESCFQVFDNVLEKQAEILVRKTFYKKKEDLFKDFTNKHKEKIVSLSKQKEFNENLAKQCFRLFVNEDVDVFTNDQVYKSCINVLMGLIVVETLNDRSGILLPLQKILKNLLFFYMQQFDELSAKKFCYKFKDLLQGVLRFLPKNYKSELKERFYQLLINTQRILLCTKAEINSFCNLYEDAYDYKRACFGALQKFKASTGNLKLLPSASIYLDRFPASNDGSLNKFIFFSAKKEKDKEVVPEIHCFLSLESMRNENIDLTAFSICLYNKKSTFWDGENEKEVFLYPQIEDNKFYFLEEIKVSMLDRLDASRILNSKVLTPSFNALINEDLCQGQKFFANNNKDEESIDLNLSSRGVNNRFYGLLWESCLQEKNAEVQHVLTNYSLGLFGMGDKCLRIQDSISPEKQKQQLEIRVYVFATDELLLNALQVFNGKLMQKFSKPMFLDYNEKKECFELLDLVRYQARKIYGNLDQRYSILKRQTETIVNQVKIDELMDALLKQLELDMEGLDMGMVRELELLLENEEEIIKLSLAIEEIFEKKGKIVGAFDEIQNILKERMEGLERLRQEVKDSKLDFGESFNVLNQKYLELEKYYRQLQENSKGAKLSDSGSWERRQAQRKKNEEDWNAFKQQEAEHERAWKLYKEEIQQAQEVEQKRQAELKRRQEEEDRKRREEEQRLERERKEKEELRRQQEEAERIRKAEEERKRREEEQRKLAEQQRLERERLEREEAERRRIAAEEQRRREEEARKPKGVTGQQIVDYAVQHSTPQKAMIAKRLVRASKIMPSQLYTNRNQIPPILQFDFDALMSEQSNK